ncbi:MAG: MipA/OmpV family protein [Ideonella sp.]
MSLSASMVLIAALACDAAQAAGSLLLIEAPPPVATFAVGSSMWALPAYPGSRRERWTLLPGLDWYAPSGLFASTDLGLGWNLSRRRDLQAGLRLWPDLGRGGRDLPRGINAVGPRLQVEGFFNYQLLPVLLLQSGASFGAGRDRDGAQLELGATSGLPIGNDLLGIGLAATLANRAYRQSTAGVSPGESQASGLAAWQVSGGWHDVSLTLSFEHKFDGQWRLDAQWIAACFLGDTAHSPLVKSRRQDTVTMTLWYAF